MTGYIPGLSSLLPAHKRRQLISSCQSRQVLIEHRRRNYLFLYKSADQSDFLCFSLSSKEEKRQVPVSEAHLQ